MKIFINHKTAHLFVDLCETLSENNRKKFGKALRKEADEKMTNDETLDNYYLTDNDINRIYLTIK